MTKKKVFISIVGLALLIVSGLVLSVGYAKKGVVLSPAEQAEIESIIKEVIQQDTQKDIITEEEYRESLRKDSENPDFGRFRKVFKECLETGDNCLPRTNRVESDEITLGEMEKLDGNKLSVKVSEHRIWYSGNERNGSGFNEFVFTLIKEDGKWRVKKFLKLVPGGFWLDSETGQEIDLRPDWIKKAEKNDPPNPSPKEIMQNQTIQLWRMGDVTPEQIEDLKEMQERFPGMKIEYEKPKELNFQEKSITALATSYTYNRNNAAWYGSYYAENPNSSFRYFSDADCTNFISQAVWYGNWPWVGGWPNKTSNSVWWYSFSWQGESDTWRRASKWFEFTLLRPRGIAISNVCNLQKGDIIQRDNYPQNGLVDHSLIVTDVKPNCEIRVSYHTPNKKDVLFKDFKNQYSNATFYYWQLYNSGS